MVLMIAFVVATGATAAVAPGDPAPAFALAATDGRTLHLSDFAGKTLVLAFFPKAFTSG